MPYDANGVRVLLPGGDDAIRTVVGEENYSQDQRLNLRVFGSLYSEINFGGFQKPWKVEVPHELWSRCSF
jgi:hypothetical protein